MANEQNLIPNSQRSPSELREQCRKGGIASGKARREKANFIKCAKALLDCSLSEQNKKAMASQYPNLEDEELSYRTMIILKQLEKALKGDINSAKFMIDVTGEKPSENISGEIKLPVLNIEVVDNKNLEKEFDKYDEVE